MTDLPLLSEPNLQQQLVEIHYQGKSLEELEGLSAVEKTIFYLLCKILIPLTMMRKWYEILLCLRRN